MPTVLPGIGAFDNDARDLDQASLIRLMKACPLFDEPRRIRVKVNGHGYRLSDSTAGVRAYTGARRGAKFWLGFYNGKAADRFSGLPLTIIARSASEQEYNLYPELIERVFRILGRIRSVRGDMGLGVKKLYLSNSEQGIFSVIPPKGNKQEPEPADRERVDRHGIERCENCGGPTKRISFAREPKPRVFFECTLKPFPECHGKQSMLCEEEPRHLLPLRQDTELYQALETQTFQYERAHRFARQRNGSGADSPTTRPKRKGVGWEQLRADATVLSDWLKACFRQGWLPIPGMTQRNTNDPVAISGRDELAGLRARRLMLNLHRPYGYRARRLGIGPVRLPQPDGVALAVPDITQPAPSVGQRQGRGGRPRPLTLLPDELPELPVWAEQLAPETGRKKKSKAKPTDKSEQAGMGEAEDESGELLDDADLPQPPQANFPTQTSWDPTDISDPRSPPHSGAGPPADPDDVPF